MLNTTITNLPLIFGLLFVVVTIFYRHIEKKRAFVFVQRAKQIVSVLEEAVGEEDKDCVMEYHSLCYLLLDRQENPEKYSRSSFVFFISCSFFSAYFLIQILNWYNGTTSLFVGMLCIVGLLVSVCIGYLAVRVRWAYCSLMRCAFEFDDDGKPKLDIEKLPSIVSDVVSRWWVWDIHDFCGKD